MLEKRGKVGEILSVRGELHPGQLERALWLQRTCFQGKRIGRILVETGMVRTAALYSALCHQHNLPERVL